MYSVVVGADPGSNLGKDTTQYENVNSYPSTLQEYLDYFHTLKMVTELSRSARNTRSFGRFELLTIFLFKLKMKIPSQMCYHFLLDSRLDKNIKIFSIHRCTIQYFSLRKQKYGARRKQEYGASNL